MRRNLAFAAAMLAAALPLVGAPSAPAAGNGYQKPQHWKKKRGKKLKPSRR